MANNILCRNKTCDYMLFLYIDVYAIELYICIEFGM